MAAVLATAAAAAAHPLGNFTVNHYARVEISAGLVRVYLVLNKTEPARYPFAGTPPNTELNAFFRDDLGDLTVLFAHPGDAQWPIHPVL